MREFVESLAKGEGNFYDGWMKNPMSAMISCNDGFRPFSFYIEVIHEWEDRGLPALQRYKKYNNLINRNLGASRAQSQACLGYAEAKP